MVMVSGFLTVSTCELWTFHAERCRCGKLTHLFDACLGYTCRSCIDKFWGNYAKMAFAETFNEEFGDLGLDMSVERNEDGC